MPTPRLTDEQLLADVELVKHYGGVAKASKATGRTRSTLDSRYQEAKHRGLIDGPTISAENPLQAINDNLRDRVKILEDALASATRPRFTIRCDNVSRSEKFKGIVIGDAHNSPHIKCVRRFEWIGAHVNAVRPDFVESIGDFDSIDSLNTHDGNETILGRQKPSWADDLAQANLARQAYRSRLNYKPDEHIVEGNHERRIYAFENCNPEMGGTMVAQYHAMLEHHGWTHSPYGHINYRGGVGFVHCAINRLGKSYGGKNAEQTISNDSVHDLVIGHSHTQRMHRAPKIGGNGYVQILNVGCALPDGHIENYAKHALNGWSYGIMEVTIQHGHIQDYHWVSMARLEELYG